MNTSTVLFSAPFRPDDAPDPPTIAPPKKHHMPFIESAIAGVATVGASVVIFVTANEAASVTLKAADVAAFNYFQWALLPTSGALVAGLMAFFANRTRDKDRYQILARFIGAVAAGVFLPRLCTYIYPAIKDWGLDPLMITGSGFAFGLFGYAIAVWLVDYVFAKAPEYVEHETQAWIKPKPPAEEP